MSNSIASSSTTTIYDLPEPLLILILSFLYIKDAIQTSLVSRSFRNLWHSNPSLHFDIFEFYSRATSPNPRCDHSRQLFAEFISQTLSFRPLNPLAKLTKFQLDFEYTNFHRHQFHVQSWIRYAINSSVTEIHLDFSNYRFYRWPDEADEDSKRWWCWYYFHLLDIYKSDVKVLKLTGCRIRLPPETNAAKFVSLKSLELAVEYLAYEDVCDLLERCVNLEILKLISIEFYTTGGLVIHSDTLKEFYLKFCINKAPHWPLNLDIWCPSLEKISLINLDIGRYINKDTTNLVEAFIEFLNLRPDEKYNKSWETMLRYFTNISSLQVWEEVLESNEVPCGCVRIASNVKHLELYCAYNDNDLVGLAALLKLLPKLEILGLRSRGVSDENLHKDYMQASTVFNMPCLKKIILRKYRKTKSERHFINLFKKSGIVLEKIVLLHFKEEDDEHYEAIFGINFARP